MRIAINGEPRSWLTARGTAVFIASLRLSASASRLRGEPLAFCCEPFAFLRQFPHEQGRLSLLGAPSLPGRKLADDDGRDHEDEERRTNCGRPGA